MTWPGDPDGGYARDALGSEEVLETRPVRSGRRRGIGVLTAAVVGAAAITVFVAQHQGGRSPHAAPTAAVSTTAGPGPIDVTPAPLPVPDQGPEPVLMFASTLYTVRDGSLVAHRADSMTETSVTVGDPAETGGSYLLAADPTHTRIWVVKSLPARILIYAFEIPGLREARQLHIEGQLAGIDQLNGELYLSASAGVVGVGGKRDGLLDWTPLRGGQAIAADRTRNRLLLLDEDGAAVRIRAESPDLTRPGISAPLPLLTGTFLIVNGRIWAGGSGVHGAVVAQLDPRTLRTTRHSAVESQLRSSAVLVAAGARSFLVRSSAGESRLWCVDAASGTVLRTWRSVSGPVVVDVHAGAAVNGIYSVSAGSTPVRLANGRCPG